VIGIFGDSVPAWLLSDAAASFDNERVTIVNVANEACDAMVGLPLGRDRRNTELRPPDTCQPWTAAYPVAFEEAGMTPDTAVMVLGQAPSVDRLVEGVWRHPCDGIEWYLDDVSARIEFLRAAGIDVVFALPGRPGDRADYVLADDATERFECIRGQLRTFLDAHFVRTIDLDQILCPDDDCNAVRSIDGTHVDPEHAPAVLDWLIAKSAPPPS
jgi:hypothetical protein